MTHPFTLMLFILVSIFVSIFNVKAHARGHDMIFVLDNSATMAEADPELLFKKDLTEFISEQKPQDGIGIIIFDEKAHIALPLTQLSETSKRSINEKIQNALEKLDYTGQLSNLSNALIGAIQEFKSKSEESKPKIIVLFSHGIIQSGNSMKDNLSKTMITESLSLDAKTDGIVVFSLVFTKKADYHLLETLSEKTEGDSILVPQAQNIADAFENLSHKLDRLSQKPANKTVKESASSSTTILSVTLLSLILLFSIIAGFIVFKIRKKKKSA